MKKIYFQLLVLPLVFICSGAYSQIQTFGVLRTGTTSAIKLATINPVSGNVTAISTVPFSNSFVGNGLSTIDPFNKRYYIQSQGKLYGIDMTNGTTATSPTVTTPTPGYFDMMVFNCSDTTIYGLFRNASTQAIKLAKINPVSGVVTAISVSSFTSSFVWNGWATIDRVNKIYYIQSAGQLWGISLTSGAVISSPTLTFPYSGYFDMMIYNNNNGTLYGLMRTTGTMELRLAKANVSTGVVSTISTNTFANSFVVNAGSAIDPVNGRYYIQSNGKFWGLDLATGTVVTSPSVNVPSGSYFDLMEMNINNCNGSYVEGISTALRNNSAMNETELFPNPAQNTFVIKKQNSGLAQLILMDIRGQKVLEQQLNNSATEINTRSLPRGIYFCVLVDGTQTTTHKLILD
ncbi:MAG: T9SS type A sorting domain-containing protein [Bacteroidia bacterium]|nr:T9SS type A sorting domain-containing protein [Bacteroidia bacterium]